MRLHQWLVDHKEARPIGIVLEDPQILRLSIKAIQFYRGYTVLEMERILCDVYSNNITEDTCLSASEWAIIARLADLYIERENAMHLEASRVLGVDVYGRSVSEVEGDITAYEDTLPQKAFSVEPFSV